MSLNPLNELKRRLEDEATSLPKRLCLAKNVIDSEHFPAASKERIVAEWLVTLTHGGKLTSKEIRGILGWVNNVDDLSSELKCQLIKVLSEFIQNNAPNNDDVNHIVTFLENDKITGQLCSQFEKYLLIATTLLNTLREQDQLNVVQCRKILNNLTRHFKESKKKLEFIFKLLERENLETIFSFLSTECYESVINVCQSILFPVNKKSFFISYLQTLIRKDNIGELISEKGDNIQSVIRILDTFFKCSADLENSQKFLSDYIEVFISSFKKESQLVFAFCIMAADVLNMEQMYLSPEMKLPKIALANEEKSKRSIFLKMLQVILHNEVDINIRLTDTFGEKISKVETKKTFISFLQAVMLGQIKLEGKLDKTTLQIIKTALKLDPLLIEQKIDVIIPPIMTAKKSNSSVLECYVDTLNCLLEILFKLSRGALFVHQILPSIKLRLEAGNTDQLELKEKIQDSDNEDCEKLKSKLITGNDVFPQECVNFYGLHTAELMFRQNKELLLSLQCDFEEHCLSDLSKGDTKPSTIVLTEVLSAILSSFLNYNKMADHTVPLNIAEDFWSTYEKLENECLRKFGKAILKLDNETSLILSFLNLCLSYSRLKLLNLKYGNPKLVLPTMVDSDVFDLSTLLPCLNSQQWMELTAKVNEYDAVLVLDNLLLTKTMAFNIHRNGRDENPENSTEAHLIKQISTYPDILESEYFSKVLFSNLETSQLKQLAKTLVKSYLNNPTSNIFKMEAIYNNRLLLNALVIETVKNITKCLQNVDDLTRALSKSKFEISAFLSNLNVEVYFNYTSIKSDDLDIVNTCVEILKSLQIYHLEENYQLTGIFVLLALKKCGQKSMRKNIDHLLQSIFELSPKVPDIFKIFTVKTIFTFDDKTMIDLLTLKIKTSNNLLLIKSILEIGVKKVKTDSEIIKTIVELLLQENKSVDNSSIESFSDPAFQISCLILPIIAKEKKAITTSAYRSILANLQEQLHKKMLDSFKNIDFSNSSLFLDNSGNIDDSMVSDSNLATLNAMGAYSLTLSRYCETTDAEEIKKLDCLWSGLEFFMQNAIKTIENPESKIPHIGSSIQILNVILRHIKKLDSHPVFKQKDKVFHQIWLSIKARLHSIFEKKVVFNSLLEEISVTLKFVCELSSVESFAGSLVGDLANMAVLKKPSIFIKHEASQNSPITQQKVLKHLWKNCLKANIIGPKCSAVSKLMSRICRNLRSYIQMHYENDAERVKTEMRVEDDGYNEVKVIKIEDVICEVVRINLDMLSESILAAKKISLDYKSLDSIFELQHLVHYFLSTSNALEIRCELSWPAFFKLFEGSVGVLNSLVMSREELLEDRWPNFMQSYRVLISSLCQRSSHVQLEKHLEEKFAEIAHYIEKLTQTICKRKTHVSRIAAYTVADICSLLETSGTPRMVRQHLENTISLLIQASDNTYAMAFLRRALAGSSGQMTMTNMYTMYKRYHKYVGNA